MKSEARMPIAGVLGRFAALMLVLCLPTLSRAQGNAYQPQLLTGLGAPGTGSLLNCAVYQQYLDTGTGNYYVCKPDQTGQHGTWVIATLVALGTANSWTAAQTFSAAANLNAGGALNGSFSGPTTLPGTIALNGCQYVNASQTLPAAIIAVSNPGCIKVNSNYVMAASSTIASGVTLVIEGNGGITTTGFTLTINGGFVAPEQQVFFGTGTVSFVNIPTPIFTEWFPGADIGAQFNNAEASVTGSATGQGAVIATGPCVTGCDAAGDYQFSTQIVFNKPITWTSMGHGATNNAGEHFPVGLTWTGGAGPATLMSGTACSGSQMSGFRFNNTSTTLTGFHSTENGCGKTLLQNIYIDPAATAALSYGIQIGNPATGAVNDTKLENIRIVGAAPIGIYGAWTSANLVLDDVWSSSNGVTGTVNTSNGALGGCAANCAQVATGPNWPTDGSWTNVPIVINNVIYTVSSVNSGTSLTLGAAPGTQTGVTYGRGSQYQFGSSTTSSNIMTQLHGYGGPSVGGAVQCTPCLSLPVVQYVNILGDHVHVGTTFEIGSNGGVQGYAQETNAAATINGSITCVSCTMNATQGPAAGVTSYLHFNNNKTSYSSLGSAFGANSGILAATAYYYQNDNSASIVSQGNAANVSVTVNLANGSLGTAHVNSVGDTTGGNPLGLVTPASTLFGDAVAFGQTNSNVVGSTGDINVARKSGNLGQIFFGTGNQRFGYSTLTSGAYVETPGQTIFQEATCVAGSANNDLLCADSSAHRLRSNPNNAGLTSVALFTDNLGVFASGGTVTPALYASATNCAVNSVSPAACGAAASGAFVIPTTTTSYTVNTTAVTAASRIFLFPMSFAGNLPSSPTCVVPAITAEPTISAISAGTSFTMTEASTTGQTCWQYLVVN